MVYRLVLFLHVLGAVGFFCALALQLAAAAGTRAATAMESLRFAGALAGRAADLLRASGALVLVTGALMLATAWHWRAPWAWTGLAATAVAGVLGTGPVIRWRRQVRQAAGASAGGPLPLAAVRLVAGPEPLPALAAACGLLTGVLVLMTVKPGAVVSVAVALAGAAAGWALGLLATQGAPTPT